MDKYEFNIKVEQIKKLVNKSDYETAMKIADTIDWRRVRNINLLSMIALIYEKNEEFQEAKNVLLLAFERAPIGKRLLYKLAELALREGSLDEAETYYREFCDIAPDDPRQQLLRYMILKEKGAPVQQLIHSLESYADEELDEKWMYELAELYHIAGMGEKCVQFCDKIMLMFGLGKYVEKAMELKIQYEPLTTYQMDLVENRDKYEEKLRAVEQRFNEAPGGQESTEAFADIEEPSKLYETNLAAKMKEAEVEANLARELSRMSAGDLAPDQETDSSMGKTRVMEDIRHLTASASDFPGEVPAAGEFAASAEEEYQKPYSLYEEDYEDEEDISPEPVIEEDFSFSVSDESEKHLDYEYEPEEESALLEEEKPDESEALSRHLMIEAEDPDEGLSMAVAALKKIHSETGTNNPVLKINGSKLSARGIAASREKLAGKDLIVETASDLTDQALNELDQLLSRDTTGILVVLIDAPEKIEQIHRSRPSLAGKFDCIGEAEHELEEDPWQEEELEAIERAVKSPAASPAPREKPQEDSLSDQPDEERSEPGEDEDFEEGEAEGEYSYEEDYDPSEELGIDEFAQFACKYAGEIDCSVTGKSMLALYERIEIMEEDGIPLTRENAINLIEEAADRAEKPSLGKLLKGVFTSKYDKDGLLILKEEHFIH